MDKMPWKIAGIGIALVAVTGLSFLGFLYPVVNAVLFWCLLALLGLIAYRSLLGGTIIVFVELIIGNKGYAFSQSLFGHVLPLRQAFFLILILATVFWMIRERRVRAWDTPYRWWLIALAAVLGIGAVTGWVRNPHSLWFYDLNAYFFFLLIFPIAQSVIDRGRIRRFLTWVAGAALSLALVNIVIATLFSTLYYRPGFINATEVDAAQLAKLSETATAPENAQLGQTTAVQPDQFEFDWREYSPERPLLYRWLRNTGTADVAYLGNRFFRVFLPSDLYLAFGALFSLAFFGAVGFAWKTWRFWRLIIVFGLFGASLGISVSRSLWFGSGVGLISLLGLSSWKSARRCLVLLFGLAVVAGVGLSFLAPKTLSVFTDRFQTTLSPANEVASSNRLQLLPAVLAKAREHPIVGSGFGTTVTYRSLIAGTDEVEYTKVYMFEWAYLDLLVKIGIVGLGVLLAFLARIAWVGISAWRKNPVNERPVIVALFACFICVLSANYFTPYLNHPLGIGAILFISTSLLVYSRQPAET